MLLPLIATCQTTANKAQSELGILYEKAKNSMSCARYGKAFNIFTEKMFPDPDYVMTERFTSGDGYMAWIKEHLDKTAFKTYEEAEKDYAKLLSTFKEYQEENAAYLEAWRKADDEESLKYMLTPGEDE